MILLKKNAREEEFYFAPTKSKKGPKGKKGSDDSSGATIKHNVETFRLFDMLKLDAPVKADEIPAILEKLEEQLKDYQNKVKEWEATREEQKRRIMEGKPVEEEEAKEAENEEKKDDEEE